MVSRPPPPPSKIPGRGPPFQKFMYPPLVSINIYWYPHQHCNNVIFVCSTYIAKRSSKPVKFTNIHSTLTVPLTVAKPFLSATPPRERLLCLHRRACGCVCAWIHGNHRSGARSHVLQRGGWYLVKRGPRLTCSTKVGTEKKLHARLTSSTSLHGLCFIRLLYICMRMYMYRSVLDCCMYLYLYYVCTYYMYTRMYVGLHTHIRTLYTQTYIVEILCVRTCICT